MRPSISDYAAGIKAALARRRLDAYRPYPKQARFHAEGAVKRERALMAGNQLGKTLAAGYEVAMHLTGQYPPWWQGKRFDRANRWIAGSETIELTRKGIQRVLLGPPEAPDQWGTGSIPAAALLGTSRKSGVADSIDTLTVRHASGGTSSLQFAAYEQGRSRWQADTIDGVWYDEEPPEDVYMEGMTRTNVAMGPVILTLTPLKGMSTVVKRFYPASTANPGCSLTMMTIEDADHYSPEARAAIIAAYPEHERDARTKGIPMLGSGRIFPVPESLLSVEHVTIPSHWPLIAGIDFGIDHYTALAWLAWDRDTDTTYLYDAVRVRGAKDATPAAVAPLIKVRGDWVPVSWPADGLQTEKGTGYPLAEQYRQLGVNFLHEPASLPETGSEAETRVSRYSVEAGVMTMLEAMKAGRFKVAAHLNDWWDEFRTYHRKDGKIVKENDDLISAVRYAYVMRRYAIVAPDPHKGALSPRRPYDWRAG